MDPLANYEQLRAQIGTGVDRILGEAAAAGGVDALGREPQRPHHDAQLALVNRILADPAASPVPLRFWAPRKFSGGYPGWTRPPHLSEEDWEAFTKLAQTVIKMEANINWAKSFPPRENMALMGLPVPAMETLYLIVATARPFFCVGEVSDKYVVGKLDHIYELIGTEWGLRETDLGAGHFLALRHACGGGQSKLKGIHREYSFLLCISLEEAQDPTFVPGPNWRARGVRRWPNPNDECSAIVLVRNIVECGIVIARALFPPPDMAGALPWHMQSPTEEMGTGSGLAVSLPGWLRPGHTSANAREVGSGGYKVAPQRLRLHDDDVEEAAAADA